MNPANGGSGKYLPPTAHFFHGKKPYGMSLPFGSDDADGSMLSILKRLYRMGQACQHGCSRKEFRQVRVDVIAMPDSGSHINAMKCRFQTARNALLYPRIPVPASGFGLPGSQPIQTAAALVDGVRQLPETVCFRYDWADCNQPQ